MGKDCNIFYRTGKGGAVRVGDETYIKLYIASMTISVFSMILSIIALIA